MPPESTKDLAAVDCSYCGQRMQTGHFLIGGWVGFAESSYAFGPVFASKEDTERMIEGEEVKPVQVIVGKSGYHVDTQNWPKRGMFCQSCLAIVVKVQNE